MSSFATTVAACIFGYLLGSVPIALMVAERHGVHIRAVGDQNPGFLNARTLLGLRSALPVLIGDIAKGAGAAGVGALLADDGQWWLPVAATAAAMVGHAFPILAEFQGGRGAATFVGGAVVFAPLPWLIALAAAVVAGLLAWALRRSIDPFRAAMWAGLVAFPLAEWRIDGWPHALAAAAMAAFVVIRTSVHRTAESGTGAVTAGGW